MNKPTTHVCFLHHPRLTERLFAFFGRRIDQHGWDYYARQKGHIIFLCRWCECGADQVNNNGPMGDGKWRDIDGPWPNEWEKTRFEKSRIRQ